MNYLISHYNVFEGLQSQKFCEAGLPMTEENLVEERNSAPPIHLPHKFKLKTIKIFYILSKYSRQPRPVNMQDKKR
jgi:hypothetical protein